PEHHTVRGVVHFSRTNRRADISRTWPRSGLPCRGPTPHSTRQYVGGGERTRTADFYVANVALYQLSYTPEGPARIEPPPGRPTFYPTCVFACRLGSAE